MAPSYLSDLLAYHMSSYSLRSVSKGDLIEPFSRTRMYGDRSFEACAPRLWNLLPLAIRRSSSVDILKKVLKSDLLKYDIIAVLFAVVLIHPLLHRFETKRLFGHFFSRFRFPEVCFIYFSRC